MPLIQVPLQRGQDARVDAKVAPLGTLKTLANARMTRMSRVAKRPGAVAASLTGAAGSAVVSGSLPAQRLASRDGERLVVAYATVEQDAVYGYGADGRLALRGYVSPWEAPEVFSGPTAIEGDCDEVSGCAVNSHYCLAWVANQRVFAAVYGSDGVLRKVTHLDNGNVLRRPIVSACGTSFVLTWAENTSAERLLVSTFDTNTAGASWSAAQDITSGTTFLAGSFDYDAVGYSSTKIVVAYRYSSTDLGVFLWDIGSNTRTGPTNFAADGLPTVLGTTGENITVAWRDISDGFVKAQSFDGSLVSVVGPTTVFGGAVIGRVGLARLSSSSVAVFWSNTASDVGNIEFKTCHTTTHALGSAFTVAWSMRLASKPAFVSGTTLVFFGVNQSEFQRAYYLCSCDSSGTLGGVQSVVAADRAVERADSDHLAAITMATVGSDTVLAWGFPRIADGTTELAGDLLKSPAFATLRLRGSKRGQVARDGASLLMACGYIARIDSTMVAVDAGQVPPKISELVAGSSGSLTQLGSYQYVITVRFYDASGRLLLSQVSDPESVTLTGAEDSAVVGIDALANDFMGSGLALARVAGTGLTASHANARIDVWRTLNAGAIFYRATDADGINATSYEDTAADTAIRTNPIVYTQGERGGLSGPLQNDTPPPCRYIWAGKDRVIVGGLEDPSEVRWSKLFFPGEAVHFSNHRSFKARIPGRVGAVAVLDDVWTVFATDAIFTVSGAGPDDTAQGGFDEPRRLGSPVGCQDWRSLVETPQGLMFQGNDGELWLLPRGFGSPIWVGRHVSDVLATYPVVTSATLVPEEHIVAFTVTTSDGASGRVLCYDYTQLDESGAGLWSVDTIAGGVAHVSGALWDGKLALATTTAIDVMTPGTYSDRTSTWYGVTIETHPLKPGGMQGDGRTREIIVLGEYRGNADLQMSIAVGDSPTFSSAHALLAATGLTVGAPVRRGWQIPNQKGGSYAVKIEELQNSSDLTEGLAFVGIAFDFRPRRDGKAVPLPPIHR